MEELKYKVSVDTSDADKAQKNLKSFGDKARENFKGVSSGISDFGDKLSNLPGNLGNTASAFKGLASSMMALVANPIGAIIAGLVGVFFALREALSKSEKGMDAIAKVTAIFGAIINPIIQAVSEFAAVLVEGLAAGLETVASLFGTAATEGRKFAEMQDELEDQELSINEARAQGNKELAQARELLSDSNATLNERRKALSEVSKSETELAAKELKFAQQKLYLAKEDQRLNGETEASKKAISDAVVKVAEAETDLAAKRRLFNRESKKLDAEEEAAKKEAAQKEKERQKELDSKRKEYKDNRIAASDKIREAEQKNLVNSIKDEEARAKKQLELDLANSKREIQNGKYTKAEKAKLIQLAEKDNQLKLTAIETDAEKKRLENKKKADEELKAFNQKSADDEAKFIDEQFAKEELNIVKSISNEEERINALNSLELQRIKNQIQARKDAGLVTTDLEKALAQKEIDITKSKADKKKELDQKEFDNKVALANATTNILGSLNSLAGENAEMGKAIAVAQAVIDTYAGATKALAQGGTLGFVGAAAVVAAGLANVNKILSTDIPNSEGGASAGANIGMPSVSMVQPQTNSNSQLAGVLGKNANKPTRAYVVGQDMSTQQSLDRHIQQNATF